MDPISEDQAVLWIVPEPVMDSRWGVPLVDIQTAVPNPFEDSLCIPAEESPLPALYPVARGVPVVTVPVVVSSVVVHQEVVDQVLDIQLV